MRIPKNLVWKLVSLLLAILVWLAYTSTPDVVTTYTAPIVYRNLASGWMVTGNSPENVHLELRGTPARLTPASLADAVVLFDLGNVNTTHQERTFTIAESNLNLPPGVVFLRAVPSQLRLRLARLAAKEVPVEIQLSGSLPSGFRIREQSVSPDRLRVDAQGELQGVTDDILGQVEAGIEDVVSGNPSGHRAIGRRQALLADGMGRQLLQVLRSKCPRPPAGNLES